MTQQSLKHGTDHTDPGDLQQLLVASRGVVTLVTLDVGCWQVRVRVVVHESRSSSEPDGLSLGGVREVQKCYLSLRAFKARTLIIWDYVENRDMTCTEHQTLYAKQPLSATAQPLHNPSSTIRDATSLSRAARPLGLDRKPSTSCALFAFLSISPSLPLSLSNIFLGGGNWWRNRLNFLTVQSGGRRV